MALMLLAMPLTAFAEDETAKLHLMPMASITQDSASGHNGRRPDLVSQNRLLFIKRRRRQGHIRQKAEFDAGTFTDAVIEGNGTYTVSYKTSNFGGAVNLQQPR